MFGKDPTMKYASSDPVTSQPSRTRSGTAKGRGAKRPNSLIIIGIGIGAVIIVLFALYAAGVFGSFSAAGTVVKNTPLAQGSLYINEVVTSNGGSLQDPDYTSPDWIELYNAADTAIDLENFALSDDINAPGKYLFPKISIPAKGYLVFYAAKKVASAPEALLVTGFKLPATGLTLHLITAGGDTLQALDIPALDQDVSYARDSTGTYRKNGSPTPGQPNTDTFVSEKAMTEMPDDAPLHITEVLIKNTYSILDAQGDRSPWVEVSNTSSGEVQLADYTLSDDLQDPGKWTFPQLSLQPGASAVVFCSGKGGSASVNGELHTGFKLGAADATLVLTDTVDMQQQKLSLPDALKTKDNVSYGLQDGKWLFFSQPTPGMPNTSSGYETIADVKALDLAGLWINETSAVQKRASADLDWIELANGGSGSVSLDGWYLSNDPDNLKKFKLGDITVPAKGYKLIYVSSSSSEQKAGVLPFGLSLSGETLVLSSPQGFPVDIFKTGVQRLGITSGRIARDDTAARAFFTTPTPGAANAAPAATAYADKPAFSVAGGFHSDPVTLAMSSRTPGAQIYYTLDGSNPTQSSQLYQEPLSISANTPVRAIAYGDGLLSSEVQTATYLFKMKHSLPIVCLSMAPQDFRIVYANSERLRTVERTGYVEYYDENGRLGIDFPTIARVAGWSTREFAQKALTFKLSASLGVAQITYPFFKDYPITTFSSLSMRCGGQDAWLAFIRDSYFSRVGVKMGLDAAENRWAVLYVNGEYRGLYDIREDLSKNSLADKHGVDPNTVNYLRRDNARAGSKAEYERIRYWGRSHSLANEENYQQYCQWVDAQGYADFLVATNYFSNGDLFNQKRWHTSDYKVKLRPIYYDLDLSLKRYDFGMIGTYFSFGGFTSRDGTPVAMDITAALWTSPTFRNLFIERYAYFLNHDFKPDNLLPLFDEMVKQIEPEMQNQVNRWNWPHSVSEWKSNVNELRQFIVKRPEFVKNFLKNQFNLSDERMKELFPEG
jgi:hypothetical protein